MHGILDNPEVLDNLAEGFDKETTDHPFDYAAFKEEQYDKLANLVRKHVDMDYIYPTGLTIVNYFNRVHPGNVISLTQTVAPNCSR